MFYLRLVQNFYTSIDPPHLALVSHFPNNFLIPYDDYNTSIRNLDAQFRHGEAMGVIYER